ncbi:ATP-dependent RNA helicase [Blastocladiella emersonii ATCC 22665]|nr:ATP-dependent RNA helicase [Blastocladiella emersonii ATCC 22665]
MSSNTPSQGRRELGAVPRDLQPAAAPAAVSSPTLVSPGTDRFSSSVAPGGTAAANVSQRRRAHSGLSQSQSMDGMAEVPVATTPLMAQARDLGPNVAGFNNQVPRPIDTSAALPQINHAIDLGTPLTQTFTSPHSVHSHAGSSHSHSQHLGPPGMMPGSSSSGLVLVDRHPSMGRHAKPKRLVRKPSARQSAAVQPAPVPPQLSLTERALAASGAMGLVETDRVGMSEGRWWTVMARVMTCWAPGFILKKTIGDAAKQQAWREKVALCMLILVVGGAVAYLTLGLTRTICSGTDRNAFSYTQVREFTADRQPNSFVIRGELYDLTKYLGVHNNFASFKKLNTTAKLFFQSLAAADVTALFPNAVDECQAVITSAVSFPCMSPSFPYMAYCHNVAKSAPVIDALKVGQVRFPWEDVLGSKSLLVYNGRVLNMTAYLKAGTKFLGNDLHAEIVETLGTDASYRLARNERFARAAHCIQSMYTVGFIDTDPPGCIASNIIMFMSLLVILGLILTRFFLAVMFDWFLGWKLGKLQVSRAAYDQMRPRASSRFSQLIRPRTLTAKGSKDNIRMQDVNSAAAASGTATPPNNASLEVMISAAALGTSDASLMPGATTDQPSVPDELRPYHTVVLVTCYSEGEEELKKTLDSVSATDFPDDQKLIFVVADGIITGKGNKLSTPDTVLSLMEEVVLGPTEPMSYVAIADGAKRHNKARVHVGWYRCVNHRTPIVLVVKCGAEDEQGKPKPGNRGKRDSQIILMDFFSKILLNERLCPLQFELFYKIFGLTGVNPIKYEICLMVDADTKLLPDSLARMVALMAQDQQVMGCCGETRIENKSQTWVTRIQVFEYYVSHHLGKAFESVFGGVTCLPGCFCMYRLKVQRPDKLWVPILASPHIIQQYSENVVDTLHKKNLLSLGEDRFLSTLMLTAFPKRKMMFVPRAICRTIVPHTMSMLLSQRRRWINSTIHNLLELSLARELCGVFCFSMQFVVIMEVIGSVSLPIAIAMTYYLIIMAFTGDVQVMPLVMLFCVLGLPAVLIMLTTRKVEYLYWMLIYLAALPIWNFVLPVYAKQHDHSNREGDFDPTKIPFLSLDEWMRLLYSGGPTKGHSPPMPATDAPSMSSDLKKMLKLKKGKNRAPAPGGGGDGGGEQGPK